jgi:hypothetical protein
MVDSVREEIAATSDAGLESAEFRRILPVAIMAGSPSPDATL